MNNKGGVGAIVFLLLVVILVAGWGLIGANEAKGIGVTCDTGIGDTFCFVWHKNAIGEGQEAIEDLFGS